MKKYGIPYQGSKSAICDFIVNHFVKRDNFYDLFAGGCAITDYLLTNNYKDYKNYFINDISGSSSFYICCLKGKIIDKKEFVTREDFELHKENDFFVKFCYSFGNNGYDYLYGKDVEQYKHAIHNIIFFDDYSLLESLNVCKDDVVLCIKKSLQRIYER